MSKQLITKFDPTATTQGQFNVPLPQNQQINGVYGYLLLANESSVSLIITINSDSFRVHPWQLDKIVLTEPTQFVQWQQEFILTNNASTPVSLVLVDGFTPDETLANTYPIPLVRNTNVGGTVTTAMTATLINDGSAANTVIVETTPTGQATSAFSLDNSGNVTIRTLNSNVWSVILSIISGGAGAATALFHGIADNVPATGVQSGTLGAGVLIPGANVTGNVAQATSLNSAFTATDNSNHYDVLRTPQAGGASRDILLQTWDGAAPINILDLGGNATGIGTPKSKIDNTGAATFASVTTPTGGTLNAFSTFTGAATGTYTHGLSVTPLAISALQKVASATDTYGSDTYGSTSVHINVNASPQAFVAIAVA